MLPCIPDLADADGFRALAAAGRALSELHLGDETVEPYPLEVHDEVPETLRVDRLCLGEKASAWDRSMGGGLERVMSATA